MRPPLSIALPLLAAVLLAACGGGGRSSDRDIVSSRAVPTATLPAQLPTPLIVGSEGFPATAAGRGQTYTVQGGDTPSGIAQRYGITVADLLQANGLGAGAVLRVGQRLAIPGPSSLGGAPTVGTPPPSQPAATAPTSGTSRTGGRRVYTVQSGDIAGTIAASFGITVEELARANGMSIDQISRLRVGQELIIP